MIAYQTHAEGSLIRARSAGSVRADLTLEDDEDLEWANHFLILAGVDHAALLEQADAALQLAVAPANQAYVRRMETANRDLWAANGRLARDRLGLGVAGAGSAALRHQDEIAEEVRQCRDRISALEQELASTRADRDEYRRGWVAVRSSRLTNVAARIAGHRFPRT